MMGALVIISSLVQVSTLSRQDVSYLDMALDQRGPSHTSNKQNYVLHSLCPVVPINFGQLKVFCFFLPQLPLVLVLQHRCAGDMSDIVVLGAMFH